MPQEMDRFVLIEAPLTDVWQALTDPKHLVKWFCKEATVSLHPDGEFHVNSTIPHASGNHRLLQMEPEKMLRIEWMILEYPTEVSLLLGDFRGITKVVARHTIPDDFPDVERIGDSLGNIVAGLEYLWCYAFLLLKSYLRDSEIQLRLKSGEDSLGIEWQTTIAAAPADVFRAVVEPVEVKKWNPYSGDVRVEPEIGGRYSFGWESENAGTDGPDRILNYEQNRSVTYSWHGQDPKTIVNWTVEPLANGDTRLYFTHTGFLKNPKIVLEYKLGWAHFLYAIKMLLETGQSMEDWNGRLSLGFR